MERYEYICLPINIIPDEIIYQDSLKDMKKYGYVYAEIHKGVYGLTQARITANNFLTKNISLH